MSSINDTIRFGRAITGQGNPPAAYDAHAKFLALMEGAGDAMGKGRWEDAEDLAQQALRIAERHHALWIERVTDAKNLEDKARSIIASE